VAPRPAPHRTQHRSAPSEPGFRFVPCFENSIKSDFVLCGAPPRSAPLDPGVRFETCPVSRLLQKGFCFVWRPSPRHTVPSTAPLRSLRAWSPFRDMPSFETSAKRVLFCVAPRPAPHRPQHRSAPLEPGVRFENRSASRKNGFYTIMVDKVFENRSASALQDTKT